MMRFFALSMLLLVTLCFAQDDTQASPASADYQSGFARGLELGMEMASLQGAASFSPEASGLFNQTALEFNQVLDQVFGQGSNLSNLYRLQLYGLKLNNATNITEEQTEENMTAENMTAENMTAENMTAVNATVKNMDIENATTENATTENATTENATTENATTENATTENATTENVTTENVTTENTATENTATENITDGKKAIEDIATKKITKENMTAEKAIKENITAENHTAKDLAIEQGHSLKNETANTMNATTMNATNNTKELAMPKLIGNISIDTEDSIADDLSDIIKDKDWDGNLETAPEFLSRMPGPETV